MMEHRYLTLCKLTWKMLKTLKQSFSRIWLEHIYPLLICVSALNHNPCGLIFQPLFKRASCLLSLCRHKVMCAVLIMSSLSSVCVVVLFMWLIDWTLVYIPFVHVSFSVLMISWHVTKIPCQLKYHATRRIEKMWSTSWTRDL